MLLFPDIFDVEVEVMTVLNKLVHPIIYSDIFSYYYYYF